jgi:hypothetical protein
MVDVSAAEMEINVWDSPRGDQKYRDARRHERE